jgi:hypothetical protein
LCSAKVLSQEDSRFANLFVQVEKKTHLFTSNIIILQSVWCIVVENFLHIVLIVQGKVLQLGPLKNLKFHFIQFVLEVVVLESAFVKYINKGFWGLKLLKVLPLCIGQ